MDDVTYEKPNAFKAKPHMNGNALTNLRGLTYLLSLAMHVVAVYFFAIHVSPWLVYHWFAWVMPFLRISTNTLSTDWYLQHLEIVTIVPAIIAGCVASHQKYPINGEAARYACIVPIAVLIIKLIQFATSHSSILVTNSELAKSGVQYFFDIQPIMPTRANFLAVDSARVLAQMTITAPFYAGVAYSLGAWFSKKSHLRMIKGRYSFGS